MKKTVLAFLLATLFLSHSLFADEDDYAGLKSRLTEQIKEEMAKMQIAGLSLALVDGDEVVWAQGFGYADVEAAIPADEQTVFKLASISKLFTGMSIMKLVEEGKIDLDSPLSLYIPEFSIKSRYPDAEPFTIRNMLTHHSGLPSDLLNSTAQPFSLEAYEKMEGYEERLLDYLKTVHINYTPKYVHSYSNIAYNLLALVVERVSGMEFSDYVAEYIFEPIGMEQASFNELYSRNELGSTMALPHNGDKPSPKILFETSGAGAMNASVSDMAEFIKVVLEEGETEEGQVIAEHTLEEMLTVQNEDVTLDKGVKMGLSFFLNNNEFNYAGRSYEHGGNLIQYHSSLIILPEHELGIIVTSNSTNGAPLVRKLANQILKEALKEKEGLTPPIVETPQPVKMTMEQAKELEGIYATIRLGAIEFKIEGEKLYGHMKGLKSEMELLDNGRLKFKENIPSFNGVTFKVEPIDGIKRLFLHHGSQTTLLGEEYKRVDLDPAIWEKRLGTYVGFNLETGEAITNSIEHKISYRDGVLLLGTRDKGTILLKVISDNECLLAGIGRNANESFYFIDDVPVPYVRASNFALKLKQ